MSVAIALDHVTKPDLAFWTGRSVLPDASSYRVSEHRTVCNFRYTLDSCLYALVLLPISMESSCPTFPPRTATHPSGSCRHSLCAALSSVPVFALSHHFVSISLCWAVFSAGIGSFSWGGRCWVWHVCSAARVHYPGPCISTEPTGHGPCELQHGCHTALNAQCRQWPWAPVVVNFMYIFVFFTWLKLPWGPAFCLYGE